MSQDSPGDQRLSQEEASVYNHLRRLQEYSRSDIPAMLMQRAMSSFALQSEPIPPQAVDHVSVVVYPQDPFVGQPEVRQMSAADIQAGLSNSRVRVQDSAGETAQPDDVGNYMYWPGSIEFDQINSFYYTTLTLRMFERYAQRAIPWSFPTPRITLDPHLGQEANAFYNEQDRLLGFHSFESNGITVSAATSADIVSHEAGHAVLDGLRDLYNESFGLGPAAFHEAFGDIAAVLVAMHDDSLVTRLLEWTGGNLRTDSFISAIAEQMTQSLQEHAQHVHGRTVYLRNAFNDFKAVPFDELPVRADQPDSQLSRQQHNYSRLFTGAFYDILVGIYEQLNAEMPDHIAVHRARHIAGSLLICAIELGPVGEFDFSDMAKALLIADAVLYEGEHHGIITDVFDHRGILSAHNAVSYIVTQEALPEIRLPDTLSSALNSALFLEGTVAPALKLPIEVELIPLGAHRNAAGNAFLTYFHSRKMTLEGGQFKQFDGTSIDVLGGLTLMFDSVNLLRSAFFRPVSDEDLRQIRILIADMVAQGLITDTLHAGSVLYSRQPQALWLPGTAARRSEGRHLVKYPVLFDPIPTPITDLRDYLRGHIHRDSPR